MAHLDLSYCKLANDETVFLIGSLYKETLVSLNLRSCHGLSDDGVINMCE